MAVKNGTSSFWHAQSLPHLYEVGLKNGPGYSTLFAGGPPKPPMAPPVEFDGPGDAWSPAQLLLAAIESCFLFTLRAADTQDIVTEYGATDLQRRGADDDMPKLQRGEYRYADPQHSGRAPGRCLAPLSALCCDCGQRLWWNAYPGDSAPIIKSGDQRDCAFFKPADA
jgi:hypothetical protein